ncbi:MAG: polyhydroxyalkanoic acid system family protein [Erythrobacter sp.]|jgi:hypothetical protein|nr:polyhydroxyalkanoic acid system family protein [Erythrobacter sp.]
MRVTLPHQLDPAEIRRRLEARKGEIAGYFPAGMADFDSRWASEDRMDFTVAIVGQTIRGRVEIAPDHVVIEVDLPMMLGFLSGTIEQSVKKEATRLLA